MDSLQELKIPWQGRPAEWKDIPRDYLPSCSIHGVVTDSSGSVVGTLTPLSAIGEGTFGHVDKMQWEDSSSGKRMILAMKRPNNSKIDMFLESLLQWKLRKKLAEFGIAYCVPEVHLIFRYKPSNADNAWFLMEYFEPKLLLCWLLEELPQYKQSASLVFCKLLLQISLFLEVFQNTLKVDHRDLKGDNILIVNKPCSTEVHWNSEDLIIDFPFHIVFLDFGFACLDKLFDLQEPDGLPVLKACPKVGRDIFQILVMVWSSRTLRGLLEPEWGNWFRAKLNGVYPRRNFARLVETCRDLEWLHGVTEDREFTAPLCAPFYVIRECMQRLHQLQHPNKT
jgi:serine/threonine protein kinase